MTSFVNPLLLGLSAATTGTGRDYLRSPDAVSPTPCPNSPDFAKHLADVEAAAPAAGPTATVNAATPPSKITKPTDVSSARIDRRATAVEEDNNFGFSDFMDVLNPLQHIPIVGTIYREMTGDPIKPSARIAGDLIYGAAIGSAVISAIGAIVGGVIEQQTGETPDAMVADALFGRDKQIPPAGEQPAPTMLASAEQATPEPTLEPIEAEELATDSEAPTPTPAPATAPVQVATIDAGDALLAAQATPATAKIAAMPISKAPFGGVMDMAATQTRPAQSTATPQIATSHVMAQNPNGTYATRVGNIIYASPMLRNAARTTPLPAAPKTTNAQQQPTTLAEAQAISSLVGAPAALSLPGQESKNNPKLGDFVKSSSLPSTTGGNKLPPNLVQDMMLMALDKYKSTAGLAPSEMKIGNQSNTLN